MTRQRKICVYFGNRSISGSGVATALLNVKMPFAMVTADEIASGGLASYGGVICPGGHSIRMGRPAERELIRFVEAGGGYVGICAGCQFAVRIGLIPADLKILRAQGVFDMRVVRRHPVTRGYVVSRKLRGEARAFPRWAYSSVGRVRIRYANGGLLLPREGAEMLVAFDEEHRYGAIVAGRRGEGRVVLISPHPESTPPREPGEKSQDPTRLFENAVRYVLGAGD